MKNKLLIAFILFSTGVFAQVEKDYDPAIQRTTNLQYFKPVEIYLCRFGDSGQGYYNINLVVNSDSTHTLSAVNLDIELEFAVPN